MQGSDQMDIFFEVEKLIEYSIKNGLVEREDKLLVTNLVWNWTHTRIFHHLKKKI